MCTSFVGRAKQAVTPALCIILLVGCVGEDNTAGEQSSTTTVAAPDVGNETPSTVPATTPAEQPFPTHTYPGLPDSASIGVLGGSASCPWFGSDDSRRSLVLPPEIVAAQDGDDVTLLNSSGEELARTGDQMMVGGIEADMFEDDREPCAGAPDRAPFLVSGVELCAPDQCGTPQS